MFAPRLASLVVMLVAAALASDRFSLEMGPQPSTWLLQLPLPTLVTCALRCRGLNNCQMFAWESNFCRLADSETGTSGPEIAIYRYVTDLTPATPSTSVPTTLN